MVTGNIAIIVLTTTLAISFPLLVISIGLLRGLPGPRTASTSANRTRMKNADLGAGLVSILFQLLRYTRPVWPHAAVITSSFVMDPLVHLCVFLHLLPRESAELLVKVSRLVAGEILFFTILTVMMKLAIRAHEGRVGSRDEAPPTEDQKEEDNKG